MYIEMWKNSFKQCLVYRANTIIRLFTSFVYLFVTVNIWQALYRNVDMVDGVSLSDMITYVLIVQILVCFRRLQLSRYYGQRIINGNVSIDFIRPVSLKYSAFATVSGEVVFQIIFFSVPMLILGVILWGFIFPDAVWQWAMFLTSAFLGALVYASIEYIMSLTVFWAKTAFHIEWFIGALFTLFSGAMVPLWFYPDWLRWIANMLPFRFVIFEPANIFVGNAGFEQASLVIIFQLLWIVALNVVGHFIWQRAQLVVTVQGG